MLLLIHYISSDKISHVIKIVLLSNFKFFVFLSFTVILVLTNLKKATDYNHD